MSRRSLSLKEFHICLTSTWMREQAFELGRSIVVEFVA